MAPTRTKKSRQSTTSESSMDINNFPAPPTQTIPTKTQSPARTPTRSPIKKARAGITVNQKQALIDNLQLEITERARKLRAQYAMQAQGLRTRIELRVNRIPTALRKATMGELLLKYSENTKKQPQVAVAPTTIRAPPHTSPRKNMLQEAQSQSRQSPSPMRPAKRMSDELVDKENDDLSNPKKRAKGPIVPERTTSNKLKDSQVLSPRSANSRTIPRSPVRTAGSPAKSFLARPVSPLKPAAPALAGGASSMLHNMVEKAKTSRANTARKVTTSSTASSNGAGRGKRAPVAAPVPRVGKGRASHGSQSSDASSGTVVTSTKTTTTKRTVMGTIKQAVAKKPAAPRAAATGTTGRVLRKRT